MSPVRNVHEAHEGERRRSSCMDPLDRPLGGSQELCQGAGLPRAQGKGVREPLGVGGKVICLPRAYPSPHYRVDVLSDHVEILREIRDQDVHHTALEPGLV